jgi:hypothetical protein
MKGLLSLVVGLLILGALGCQAPEKRKTALPNVEHPGSAAVQQKRALRFDPYPEPNVGPGMSDVRPRDYENPPAESSRARWPNG